jgi:class 3 adenylate cyclase
VPTDYAACYRQARTGLTDLTRGLDDGPSIAGLAVHIGARVVALAQASEVLVTNTVKALVLGSGVGFVDRGTHRLKGVPDVWALFAVQ